MARLFGTAGDKLTIASAVITPYPVSMACWFRCTDITANHHLMNLQQTSNGTGSVLSLRGDVAGDPVYAQSNDGTTSQALSAVGYSANVWSHAVAVFTATNSRAVYLDGGNKGTNTTNRTPSNPNVTNIGNNISNSVTMAGSIANAAMWNTSLTDDDAYALYKGVSPLYVKPEYLVAYWPLVGKLSPEIDIVSGYSLTVGANVSLTPEKWVFSRML